MPDDEGLARWRIFFKDNDVIRDLHELTEHDIEDVAVHLLKEVVRHRSFCDVTHIEIVKMPAA